MKNENIDYPEDTSLKIALDYDLFLKDMCFDKKDLAAKLINMLINERGPELFADLSAAVETEDGEKIRLTCHTLKGTAANMCAYRLSRKAAEFGEIAQNGENDKYQNMLEEAKTLFAEIVSWWERKQRS